MNVVMCLWMVAVAGWVKFFRPRLPMTLRMAYNLDLNLTQCFIESSPVRSSWGCWGKQKSSQLPIFSQSRCFCSRGACCHIWGGRLWPVVAMDKPSYCPLKVWRRYVQTIRAFRAGKFNCSSQGWLNSCAMGNHRSQVQFCFFGGLDYLDWTNCWVPLDPNWIPQVYSPLIGVSYLPLTIHLHT